VNPCVPTGPVGPCIKVVGVITKLFTPSLTYKIGTTNPGDITMFVEKLNVPPSALPVLILY
jgi:hypothetical protein